MAIPFKSVPAPTAPILPENLLTVQQLAERLQTRVSWVYEKCRKGGDYGDDPLPVLPCGKYLRFDWVEVCAWLRRNRKP